VVCSRHFRVAIRGTGDDRGVGLWYYHNDRLQPGRGDVARARPKRLETEMQGDNLSALQQGTSGFWMRQKSNDGAAIFNASTSCEQGAQLGGVSVYTFGSSGHFQQRIEAKNAALQQGYWQLEDAAKRGGR
jgi:hypothetical protein